jgi:hypothetical protein
MTSDGPSDRDDGLWDLLLENIAARSVVPIVGRDLLSLPVAGKPTTLYTELAERLATRLDIQATAGSLPGGSPLSTVAAEYIRRGGEPDQIYRSLVRIVQELGDVPVPTPLEQLAAIDRFALFVTTTFDDLLVRALAAARGRQPRVLGFSNKAAVDSNELMVTGEPVIYHLFGRLSSLPDYVVTDEDALEFVFSILDPRYQPTRLLQELSQRSLLIVGCSFPSWAVRFILRVTRGRRLLFANRDNIAFVVDPGATEDAGLLQFLQTFKTRTEVFTQYDAVGFAGELSRRWAERLPAASPDDVMPADAVFVSYPSEDFTRVQAIVESLRKGGLTVWFDRTNLGPGERWRDKIERGIDSASAFVPILSSQAVAGNDRYYITEWKRSLERNSRIAFDDRFLFPIVIDDLDRDSPAIPKEFRDVQWTSVKGEAVPDELVKSLNEAIRRKKTGARR